jgi:hypothetical protein
LIKTGFEDVSSQLADIATVFATSNGTNDNTAFNSWLYNGATKILIPKGITLKLGYTSTNTYISINNPIEIFGGGTIEFIGDFTQSDLFKVGANNVYIHDISFVNNTGTFTSYAKGFISTLANVDNLRVENCTFSKGGVVINRTTNATIKVNNFDYGFILAFGGSNTIVTYNKIKAVDTSITSYKTTPINWNNDTNSIGSNNYIANNYITNVWYGAIALFHYHSHSIIENNIIKTVGATDVSSLIPISLAQVNDITVRNNDVSTSSSNGTYYGIECDQSYNCIIEGNRIDGFIGGVIISSSTSGSSYNNRVVKNYITNWKTYGITLFRYTSSNIIKDNVITSSAIDSTVTNYGINLNADSKNEFNYNQCLSNKINVDASSLQSVVNIRGIYAYSTQTKISENIITIKAPKNAIGLYFFVGDNAGMTFGRNSDIRSNDIMLIPTTVDATTYGMQVIHSGTNDNLVNDVIMYNRINVVAPSGTTKWVASTAYALNANVLPISVNGYYYTCTTAGTSGTVEPTWTTTLGGVVTDGTVQWTCHGNQQLSYTSSKIGNGIISNNFNA